MANKQSAVERAAMRLYRSNGTITVNRTAYPKTWLALKALVKACAAAAKAKEK